MSNSPEKPPGRNPFAARLGIAILIIMAFWMVTRFQGGSLLAEGTKAPAWNLRVANTHEILNLNDLEGSIVLINFWSTTCPPCMKELTDLQEIWPSFKKRGVKFVGIASGGETLRQIEIFGKKIRIEFPLVADDGPTSSAYRVSALPVLYILDRKGTVHAAYTGYRGKEKIVTSLNKALKGP